MLPFTDALGAFILILGFGLAALPLKQPPPNTYPSEDPPTMKMRQ